MGVQIPRGGYSQISTQSDVPRIAAIFRKNPSRTGATEGVSDRRRALVCGSCAYADFDATQIFSVSSEGLYQRQKCVYHEGGTASQYNCAELWREAEELRQAAFLGVGVLCFDRGTGRRTVRKYIQEQESEDQRIEQL